MTSTTVSYPLNGDGRYLRRVDDRDMANATSSLLVAAGLGAGLLGAATATDVVSLRALAHGLDVPLVSTLVIGWRETMPTSLAHALEPAVGVAGGLLVALAVVRPARLPLQVAAWWRASARRTVLVFALLRG